MEYRHACTSTDEWNAEHQIMLDCQPECHCSKPNFQPFSIHAPVS